MKIKNGRTTCQSIYTVTGPQNLSGGGTSTADRDRISALEQRINLLENKYATETEPGLVRLTKSKSVTDSTGLAMPASENNAAIDGTLANLISGVSSGITERFKEIRSIEIWIPPNGQAVISERADPFAQILFLQNTLAGSNGAFILMGYGSGGPRNIAQNLAPSNTSHEVLVEGASFVVKNLREQGALGRLITFMGRAPSVS